MALRLDGAAAPPQQGNGSIGGSAERQSHAKMAHRQVELHKAMNEMAHGIQELAGSPRRCESCSWKHSDEGQTADAAR